MNEIMTWIFLGEYQHIASRIYDMDVKKEYRYDGRSFLTKNLRGICTCHLWNLCVLMCLGRKVGSVTFLDGFRSLHAIFQDKIQRLRLMTFWFVSEKHERLLVKLKMELIEFPEEKPGWSKSSTKIKRRKVIPSCHVMSCHGAKLCKKM